MVTHTISRYNRFLKLVEAEALLQIHPCFFSHSSIKQRVLPLSAVTFSLHHVSKMSEVNSHMRKNTLIILTWSEPLKICCHVVVTQLRETVEQYARKFRNVSL